MIEKLKHFGYRTHRFIEGDNYYEKEIKFVQTINEEIENAPQLLAQIVGNPDRKYLTVEEEKAVMSTIQWLGTPVGQGFLERVNKK
jgi:hypothetical protein